ncbi:hypothetical protein XENOCAPTIV_030674, partial [Xenoophorus captivus]
DALKDLFQSEGLPSSLQPLSDAMQDTVYAGQMTVGDVAQWTEEQLRDMRRLAKHLQDVRSTVQPLREALAKAETERDKFSSQLESMKKEFKQEVKQHQTSIVQLEFSLRKAQRSAKETEQRLQEEHKQLKRGGTMQKDELLFLLFGPTTIPTGLTQRSGGSVDEDNTRRSFHIKDVCIAANNL